MSLDDLRVPPQSIDSERALIGSLLLAPHFLDEVQVTTDDFYHDPHQIIFGTICQMWDRGVRALDVVTIAEELVRKNLFDRAGGAPYLGEVMESVPHAAHIAYYAQHVIEASRKRRIIHACVSAMQGAYSGLLKSDEIVAELDRHVLQLQDLTGGKDIGTIDEAVNELEHDEQNPGAVFPTGLQGLDQKLAKGGFQATNLIIMAARPGGGKSALAGQVARFTAQTETPSLIVSLEMRKQEIAERYSTIVDRKTLRGLPIYFAESAYSIDRIRQVVRLSVRKHKVRLVVVDYLQLIEVKDARKQREQQIAEVSRGLKLLAKELEIPIIVGCQLNRGSERENRKPRLIDLRESGSLEQDADVVLLLHSDEDAAQSEIIMAKQRGGRTANIPVVFDKMRTVFRDADPSQGFKF